MSQSASEITTSPKEQFSRIGMLAGGHGSATNVASLLADLPKHATPEAALRMMQCSPVFSAQRPETQTDAEHALQVAEYLKTPAPRQWIAGRIVTLLSHYFVASTDENVTSAVAEDWCAMLGEYPAWAIANACRWWMSRDNPRKHCKPLPGDIQDRAHIEMSPIRSAETMARLGPENTSAEVECTAVDPETRARQQEEIQRLLGSMAKGSCR